MPVCVPNARYSLVRGERIAYCVLSNRLCDFSSSSKGLLCSWLLLRLFRPKCMGQWDIRTFTSTNHTMTATFVAWLNPHCFGWRICRRIWDQRRCACEEGGVCFITCIGWSWSAHLEYYICVKICMSPIEREIPDHWPQFVHFQSLISELGLILEHSFSIDFDEWWCLNK
jgi:hypothetical protein